MPYPPPTVIIFPEKMEEKKQAMEDGSEYEEIDVDDVDSEYEEILVEEDEFDDGKGEKVGKTEPAAALTDPYLEVSDQDLVWL